MYILGHRRSCCVFLRGLSCHICFGKTSKNHPKICFTSSKPKSAVSYRLVKLLFNDFSHFNCMVAVEKGEMWAIVSHMSNYRLVRLVLLQWSMYFVNIILLSAFLWPWRLFWTLPGVEFWKRDLPASFERDGKAGLAILRTVWNAASRLFPSLSNISLFLLLRYIFFSFIRRSVIDVFSVECGRARLCKVSGEQEERRRSECWESWMDYYPSVVATAF